MTTTTEGAQLTQIGPGTVMGDLMRQYWIPAALSSELERDSAPIRLMLLGEKLIAFRDSTGHVGVMDHRCPHRCASLFLGRNEEGGIRCIYHGWKYDVAGNCIDMPNVLPHEDFSRKVKAKAYKTVERSGLVWVYMGSRAEAPPLPALEILEIPNDEIGVTLIQRECNYLQALEGDIDTSHFGFLHAGHVDPDDVAEDEPIRHTITSRAPEYHVADTAWGTQYAAYRPVGGRRDHRDMAPDGIVEDCGKLVVATVQPVILDDDVLAFRKPCLVQAFAKLCGKRGGCVSLSGIDERDDRRVRRRPLRPRRERPCSHRTASKRKEFPSPHGSPTKPRSRPYRIVVRWSRCA
jgi:phenylpropionate dioxygenase-like ring-hydroxylating dioxygenase large terminal subunit